MTFTRKAASELRERLEKALGGKRRLRNLQIGTFPLRGPGGPETGGKEVQLAEGMECLELAKETVSPLPSALQRRKLTGEISPDQIRQGLCFDPPGGPDLLPEAAGGKGAVWISTIFFCGLRNILRERTVTGAIFLICSLMNFRTAIRRSSGLQRPGTGEESPCLSSAIRISPSTASGDRILPALKN